MIKCNALSKTDLWLREIVTENTLINLSFFLIKKFFQGLTLETPASESLSTVANEPYVHSFDTRLSVSLFPPHLPTPPLPTPSTQYQSFYYGHWSFFFCNNYDTLLSCKPGF